MVWFQNEISSQFKNTYLHAFYSACFLPKYQREERELKKLYVCLELY